MDREGKENNKPLSQQTTSPTTRTFHESLWPTYEELT
jgi:hypothetical protein